MKLKNFIVGIALTLSFAIAASNSFAYVTYSVRPATKTLSYYTHTSLGATGKSAAQSAASTWSSVSNGIAFSRSGDSSGGIVLYDSHSDVTMADFSTLGSYDIPSYANAVTPIDASSDYLYFDILLNSLKTWGNGNGSYLDRQGILTHEFGHAAGLDENGAIPGNQSPDQVSPSDYQTMYPYSEDPLGNNLTYYFRSLTGDDINGVRYVVSQIN